MRLKNTYVIGTLIQFYELEMIPEFVDGLVQMMEGVENPENVTFHFTISLQEYLERIDWGALDKKYGGMDRELGRDQRLKTIIGDRFHQLKLQHENVNVRINYKTNEHDFYNIAKYRRDLNYNWCEKVDIIMWAETDSVFPKQTLEVVDFLHEEVKGQTPKYLLTFGTRRNWDSSWEKLVHPSFKDVNYEDNDDWVLNNEASEKSYMTVDRMNEINDISIDRVVVEAFTEPKADGSCLVITSDLIKSGANIPRGIIHNFEDISMCDSAKLVMGDQFVQYHVTNLLRVHNRRHPNKRNYVLNEDNKRGFCDSRKGDWWGILESNSNQNYQNLRQQRPFIKGSDVIAKINGQ